MGIISSYRGITMNDFFEYRKPCMTNLPVDLGISIFSQILEAPRPDENEYKRRSEEMKREMIIERNKYDTKLNSK